MSGYPHQEMLRGQAQKNHCSNLFTSPCCPKWPSWLNLDRAGGTFKPIPQSYLRGLFMSQLRPSYQISLFLLLSGMLQSTHVKVSVPLCHSPSFSWYMEKLSIFLLLFSGKEQSPVPFTGFHISWYTASFQSIDSQTSALSSSKFVI